MRALDVGTFDGFWAFELERRGADEVIAIDLLDPARWDWPEVSPAAVLESLAARKRGGEGFLVARAALRSSVVRMERSIYELDPDEIGEFDFVYAGSPPPHLRGPVRGAGPGGRGG